MRNEFYVEGRLVENPTIVENIETKEFEIFFKVKTLKGIVNCKYDEIKELNPRFKMLFTKDAYVKIEGHIETRNERLVAIIEKLKRSGI